MEVTMSKKVGLTSPKSYEWNQTNNKIEGNVELWVKEGHVKIVLYEFTASGNKLVTHNYDSPQVTKYESFNTKNKNHWIIVVTPGEDKAFKYDLEAPGLT